MQTVIYARQSLDRSGEGAAVERQVAACRDLAVSRQWTVCEVLVDNDVSASTGQARPAYRQLLEMMRVGDVDAVIVWHVDRLTRRLVDLEEVIGICEATGVRLATVTGDLDLSTDTGRMLARILASVARGEVERKGARQRAANRQRAEKGAGRWTRRPFGYERDAEGRVHVIEREAEALRQAAGHVLAGRAIAKLVQEWNTEGPPTSTGGRWTTTSIRRALLNPRIAGRSVYRGADLGAGDWPAILDADTFAQVEERLADPRRRTAFNNSARHLLSGIATCGVCGGPMYGTPIKSGERRWMGYRCQARHVTRRMDLVDEVVEGVIVARLSRPDALALLSPDVDIDALREKARDLRERRDNLAALLAEGLLSAASVREQAGRIAGELREVEGRIDAASDESPALAVAASADAAAAWNNLAQQSRRAVVKALVTVSVEQAGKGVRFDPEQVRIEWRGDR